MCNCRAGMVEERDLPTEIIGCDFVVNIERSRREGTEYGTVLALQWLVGILGGVYESFVWR
jgi:hypothetical protein